jgi:antitoxin component of MazEF toxin-antitoxin module
VHTEAPLCKSRDRQQARCRSISEVQGNDIKIAIPEWLSGMLRIEEGDLVSIDNANGKFNIRSVNARPIH